MFAVVLFLHSLVRWLLLLALVFAILKAFKGWFAKDEYTVIDNKLRLFTVIFAHVQGLIGLIVYFLSPLVAAFIADASGSMGVKEIRYFAVSHSLIMLVSIILITIGSARSKKKENDKDKFKTIAIWFTIGLVLIFFTIPWPFMPSSPSRPLLNLF